MQPPSSSRRSFLTPCFDALFIIIPQSILKKRREKSQLLWEFVSFGREKKHQRSVEFWSITSRLPASSLLNTHQDITRDFSLSLYICVSIATNFRRKESDVWAGSGSIHQFGERYDLPAAVSSLYTILGITMIDPEIPLFISILSRLSNLEEILEKKRFDYFFLPSISSEI